MTSAVHVRRHILPAAPGGESNSVDRIDTIAATGIHFGQPADFDSTLYLTGDVGRQLDVHVRMRFALRFAVPARDNSSAWGEMVEEEDGSIVVRFSTPDVVRATATVLSCGGAAVVLAPPEVQTQVRK